MHQIRFRLAHRLRLRWGRLQHSPDLPAALNGARFEEKGKRREENGLKKGEGIGEM